MLLKFKESLFPPENPKDISKITEIFEAIVDGNSNFLSKVPLQEVRDLTFTNHGRNILHVAVWYNCLSVIDAICKNNALKPLLNEKDLNAETPLHLAVYTKNFEAYKRLVRAGANVQVTNNKKERAIDLLDDSQASTDFLKSILNTENLFTSIPNDQQTEIKKRLDQQPKIAFKVTLIPTETEVNCDEGGLTKKFTNKTSLMKEDNDETRSIMERNSESIANIVPSLSYGEVFTASRKNVKGGTWLSNPNSATGRLFKDSTQIIEKSDRSLTNNLLDPHSNNRLSFLYKKDDDVTPEHANGINQFSGISNIFEPPKEPSKNGNSNSNSNSNSTSKRSSLVGSKSEITNNNISQI